MAYKNPSWYKQVPGKSGLGYVRKTTVGGLVSMSYEFGINARTARAKTLAGALYSEIYKMKGRTVLGMKSAAEYLHAQTENVVPTTPMGPSKYGIGNLRRSWFDKITVDANNNSEIEIGYDLAKAPYAWYVHEMTEPPYEDINWTEPDSGPKWFEIHIQTDKPAMLKIISENTLATL